MVGVPQATWSRDVRGLRDRRCARARHRTGEGQVIDATMIGGRSRCYRQAARYFATDRARPEGNVHASIVPYQTFRAADGFVNICCANNALFERLCRRSNLRIFSRTADSR